MSNNNSNSESGDDVCGATKTDGDTCTFTPKHSDGRCGHHTQTGENEPQGRDSKLTKEREEKIAQAIENGKSMNSAARMAGITPQTVHNWLDRGEGQEEGVYRDFFERIARAKGYGEDYYYNLALELARENGDHRFIASLMKQRYPDSWGDTDTGVDADTVRLEVSERVSESWPNAPE